MLVAGSRDAVAGSALAVHTERLGSEKERQALAQLLCRIWERAYFGDLIIGRAIPVNRDKVAEAAPMIDTIIERLSSRRPIAVACVARLRMLLADGCGPLYLFGQGDLIGALGSVLAEL
ncbi:hypothetical protein ACVWWN_003484 [Mycobacterium sp. URHB0021]